MGLLSADALADVRKSRFFIEFYLKKIEKRISLLNS